MPEKKEMHSERMARYESVALAIAEQIVKGTYLPGSRLHGRSTLAGLYRVSPETIRRAINKKELSMLSMVQVSMYYPPIKRLVICKQIAIGVIFSGLSIRCMD